MISPDDQFGRMMVENLEQRGCELLGIHAHPTLEAQKKRMEDLLVAKEGQLAKAESLTMCDIYKSKLDGEGEKARIEKLELFDEFEEWALLQSHYCLTLGALLQSADSPIKDLAI